MPAAAHEVPDAPRAQPDRQPGRVDLERVRRVGPVRVDVGVALVPDELHAEVGQQAQHRLALRLQDVNPPIEGEALRAVRGRHTPGAIGRLVARRLRLQGRCQARQPRSQYQQPLRRAQIPRLQDGTR